MVRLIAIVLVVCALAGVSAQTDPSTLPLVQLADLQYVGGFRVPPQSTNNDTFHGGGLAVAFNPARNSLFLSSYNGKVAEITIPTPVNSGQVADLPTATFLQPFFDPTEGRANEATFGFGGGISSLLVYNNRLYGTAHIYYDSGNAQRVSHYSRSLKLDEPSFTGWASVWQAEKTGYVSGFMAAVPTEWQSRLGGPALTGQCCIPIVSRTSFGPSAFAFDPAKIAKDVLVPASPLIYYDGAHQTLGEYENVSVANPVYNQSIEIHGLVVVAGTRSVLYIGRLGIGVPCYGTGTSDLSKHNTFAPEGFRWCYDLDQFGQGVHAWPYRYQIWAYDLNDLAAVKAGTKPPWDVKPYGVWPLVLPTPGNEVRLQGATYDAATQTIYVSQRFADFIQDQSYRPLLHALRVKIGSVTPPPPTNTTPTTPVDPRIAELQAQVAERDARLAMIKTILQQAAATWPKNTATRVKDAIVKALALIQ